MSAVERLAILITADGQGAIREFGKVGESAERDLGRAETTADRVGKRMTSAGAVMMGASAVMVAGMWNAGQSAAALEQSVGGSEAVFKEHAAGMQEWAEGAAQSAGLSEEAALRLSTRMGGALKGLGFDVETAAAKSKDLVQVGADLAATYGGTTEDAVQALGAAFRGEFDPMEQFNVFLKQSAVDAKAVEMGLARNTTQVDANARAQATLALITEQSADAQGQFGRETDSTSGRLAIAQAEFENLKAQVGAGFTPVMTTAGSVLGVVTGGLRSADDATGGLASSMLGIGAVGIGAAGALSFIAGQALQMKDNFSGFEAIPDKVGALAGRMGASAETSIRLANGVSAVGGALPVVGAAAVVGAGIWQMYSAQQAAAEQRAKEFTATLDEQNGALTDNTTAKVRGDLEDKNRLDNLNQAGITVERFTEALADNTSTLLDEKDVLNASNGMVNSGTEARGQLVDRLREQGGEINNLIADLLEAGAADEGLIKQIYEQNGAYRSNQDALEERAIQLAVATGKSRDQAKAELDLTAAAEAHTQAMKDQNDAQKALLDPLFGAIDALESNRDALKGAADAQLAAFFAQKAYDQAVRDHGATSKEAIEAQQALNEAVEKADDSNLAAAKSAMDVDQSMRTLSAAVADGSVKFTEAMTTLQGWVAQGLITEEQARQVAGQMGEVGDKARQIPVDTFTTAHAYVDGAIAEFNNLLDVLRRVPTGMTVTMNGRVQEVTTVGLTNGVPSSMSGRNPQGQAAGGPISPWSVYELHDTGSPEVAQVGGRTLLFTGSEGGHVTNLDRVGGRTSGASGSPAGGSGVPGAQVLFDLRGASFPGVTNPRQFLELMITVARQNQGELQRALGI